MLFTSALRRQVQMSKLGRLTHSYIIEGRDTEARYAYVQDFIMTLECEDPDDNRRPCGACRACRTIAAGTNPDICHMQMSNATGYSSEKDIAPFIERLRMNAYGRYVIGVVDEADLLREDSQNKLLKTLEEPQDDTIIILSASSKDSLLATVQSRCRVITCRGESAEASLRAEDVLDRFFYRYRKNIDKLVKTREDALALLSELEDGFRESMLAGRDMDRSIRAIEIIEGVRKDIISGMSHAAALKRLYLMLY